MSFSKEKDMTEIVRLWLLSQCDIAETELGCGFCGEYIPDLVGASFDPEKIKLIKRYNPMSRARIRKLIEDGRAPERFHTDLVGVELKLRNFPEAYFQAKMYQSFGMRSFIGMPKEALSCLKSIRVSVLRMDGIGLLSVTTDECKVVLKARKVKSNYEEEYQITERLRPNNA